MNAAPLFVQHCSPPAVLLRAAPVRRDPASRAICNANVASTAQSTAAAPPALQRDRRAARPPQAASGVRLYEVAVPLADDPGKVRNTDARLTLAFTGSRQNIDFPWHRRMISASMQRCARHPHHVSAARQAWSQRSYGGVMRMCSTGRCRSTSHLMHCTAGRSARCGRHRSRPQVLRRPQGESVQVRQTFSMPLHIHYKPTHPTKSRCVDLQVRGGRPGIST